MMLPSKAMNYANTLLFYERFEEAKVLRKTIPVARRVLGERDDSRSR